MSRSTLKHERAFIGNTDFVRKTYDGLLLLAQSPLNPNQCKKGHNWADQTVEADFDSIVNGVPIVTFQALGDTQLVNDHQQC